MIYVIIAELEDIKICRYIMVTIYLLIKCVDMI